MKNKKDITITIRMSEEEYKGLIRGAMLDQFDNNPNVSAYIRKLIKSRALYETENGQIKFDAV